MVKGISAVGQKVSFYSHVT